MNWLINKNIFTKSGTILTLLLISTFTTTTTTSTNINELSDQDPRVSRHWQAKTGGPVTYNTIIRHLPRSLNCNQQGPPNNPCALQCQCRNPVKRKPGIQAPEWTQRRERTQWTLTDFVAVLTKIRRLH